MNKYTGIKDVVSFLEFIKTDTSLKCMPMSDAKIDIIRSTFSGKAIPQSYISFLSVAGACFELWAGSDYILINKDNQFVNLASHIQNNPKLDALFRKNSFSYNDCLFFWSHQGNTYLFFELNDKNNSTVYILDANIESEIIPHTTFSEFLIDTYDSYVSSREMLENPWRLCRKNMANRIKQDVFEKFYEEDNSTVSVPYESDIYHFDSVTDCVSDFMPIFNPILKSIITNINSVYINSNGTIYLYFPEKNINCKNAIGFDLYRDKNFIIDREYEWGWIVQGNKIFVFGDKFRSLIKQSICKLIIDIKGDKNEFNGDLNLLN